MKTDTETLALLKKVREGDDDAFARLAEKYRTVTEAAVASFVGTSGGNEDAEALAEDLRQEARLALYRAAVKYDAEGDGREVTFGLYAKICIKNALISDRRRRERYGRKLERLRRGAGEGKADADTADVVVNRMELAALERYAEASLSPYESLIFREIVMGRTPREISRKVGKSAKSVSNAIYRIKAKLRSSVK